MTETTLDTIRKKAKERDHKPENNPIPIREKTDFVYKETGLEQGWRGIEFPASQHDINNKSAISTLLTGSFIGHGCLYSYADKYILAQGPLGYQSFIAGHLSPNLNPKHGYVGRPSHQDVLAPAMDKIAQHYDLVASLKETGREYNKDVYIAHAFYILHSSSCGIYGTDRLGEGRDSPLRNLLLSAHSGSTKFTYKCMHTLGTNTIFFVAPNSTASKLSTGVFPTTYFGREGKSPIPNLDKYSFRNFDGIIAQFNPSVDGLYRDFGTKACKKHKEIAPGYESCLKMEQLDKDVEVNKNVEVNDTVYSQQPSLF